MPIPPSFSNLSELRHTEAEVMYIFDMESGTFRAANPTDFGGAPHNIGGYETFAQEFNIGYIGGTSEDIPMFMSEPDNVRFTITHLSFSITSALSHKLRIYAFEGEWLGGLGSNNILYAQEFSFNSIETKNVSITYSIPWVTKNINKILTLRSVVNVEAGVAGEILGVVHGYYIPE